MSSNYERISEERGWLEKLIGRIPGYKGYKEKEMRREADRLLREALARDLNLQLNRLSPMQTALLEQGGIDWMDDIGAVKTSLQTLIDRVRHAAQGYAGFFDATRVKEDDLDRLEQFDQQLIAEVDRIAASFDALEGAVHSGAEIKSSIAASRKLIQEINDLFSRRSSVITGI